MKFPLLKKIMHSLQTSISFFIKHCKFEKGLSPKTIKAYQRDLLQLNTFLVEKKYSISITEMSKTELRDYLAGMILINPVRKKRIQIREPKTLPKVMSTFEIKKILKVAFKGITSNDNRNAYSFFLPEIEF